MAPEAVAIRVPVTKQAELKLTPLAKLRSGLPGTGSPLLSNSSAELIPVSDASSSNGDTTPAFAVDEPSKLFCAIQTTVSPGAIV